MKKKIIFFGTPDFAVRSLSDLIKLKFNVITVITNPDKKSGRGKKITFSAVKVFCLEKKIKILQPENLFDDELEKSIKNLNPDIGIVVAFKKIPKKIWQIPVFGTFNLHASLLPELRGAAPINWAIASGFNYTGATTFLLNDKIDSGKILLQKKVQINQIDNYKTLHDKLSKIGSDLVRKTIEYVINNKGTPQKTTGNEIFAPKLSIENTKINWNKKIDEIESFIRAMSPYPGAWTEFKSNEVNIKIKIFKLKILDRIEHKNLNIVFTKKNILIYHKNGTCSIEELQIPNKKRMQVRDLLNGYNFDSRLKLGN
tara:strand:- start:2285 stop:3223 length:939 start_codon:yes stop_codon:yes gene_type:complete